MSKSGGGSPSYGEGEQENFATHRDRRTAEECKGRLSSEINRLPCHMLSELQHHHQLEETDNEDV
jgi:hypothetical protein